LRPLENLQTIDKQWFYLFWQVLFVLFEPLLSPLKKYTVPTPVKPTLSIHSASNSPKYLVAVAPFYL
jgi:hypothetical protein